MGPRVKPGDDDGSKGYGNRKGWRLADILSPVMPGLDPGTHA